MPCCRRPRRAGLPGATCSTGGASWRKRRFCSSRASPAGYRPEGPRQRITRGRRSRFWWPGLSVWVSLLSEGGDFGGMVMQGAGPDRSAFLSSLFAVVGLHGLHVSAGLLWLGTMMAQVFVKGFRADIVRRLVCFNLFWHALDIIWVALFTVVYLIGLGR